MYDASPVRLPAGLSDIFPGNRKNHSPASLKLSALYRLSVRSTEWIKISAQKPHDSKFLPDLNKLKGSLFLFDLGYFSHAFLYQLSEIGVWFVCRLKANSVPIITKVVKGVAKRHIGRPLDKNVNLRGMIVEVWAKLNPCLSGWHIRAAPPSAWSRMLTFGAVRMTVRCLPVNPNQNPTV
ncbi:MAG: transposase, partial [Desulfobacterales bacterium]